MTDEVITAEPGLATRQDGPVEPAARAKGGAPPQPNGGAAQDRFVYAIGRIEAQFPSLAVEKEFAQVTGRSETAGLTDPEVLREVLSDRVNRYLARQLAWVFTVEGLETYLLAPRDPADLDVLIESIRPAPRPHDIDVVVGVRGQLASPEMARGLVVPLVFFDQVYSFDTEALIGAIPRPDEIGEDRFAAAAQEVFARITALADNAGATDAHRALNYLVVRYPPIYAEAARAYARNAALTSVDVLPSQLSNVRKIVEVVFNYTSRDTDVTEAAFVRVDVTEEFPFLVTKLSPYYRR